MGVNQIQSLLFKQLFNYIALVRCYWRRFP